MGIIMLFLCGCSDAEKSVAPQTVEKSQTTIESPSTDEPQSTAEPQSTVEPQATAESQEKKPAVMSEEEKAEAFVAVKEQVIADFKEKTNDRLENQYYYAVTDLNQNGRQELIFSACLGTGHFSSLVIYELEEDYKTTKEYEFSGKKEIELIPDITWSKSLKGIYDSEAGEYKYYEWDYLKDGAMISDDWLMELSFGEVKGLKAILHVENSIPEDESKETYDQKFYDSEGNEIDEAEYNRILTELENSYNVECVLDWKPLK